MQSLETELGLSRLNHIHQHLWWAGRVARPRALHKQKAMLRELLITEQADLHLIWWEKHILIKPLPRYLLNYDTFEDFFCSDKNAPPSLGYGNLYACASGLLWTYTHLIQYESDFKIALDLELIPKGTKWLDWVNFAQEVRGKLGTDWSAKLNQRYMYGELRRTRLNAIYGIGYRRWINAYHKIPTNYSHWVNDNFAWMLLIFAYASIFLSAMQVVLATTDGQKYFAIQKSSYEFSVAVLIAAAAAVAAILGATIGIIVFNIARAHHYDKRHRLET